MNSIFSDGFIATERKRGITNSKKVTDFVWLTEKTQFPKTALPQIPGMPETNLMNHLYASIYVNLDKVRMATGGIFRFGFESTDMRLEKWRFSDERKKLKTNLLWRTMEKVADKVGDDVRSFWISSNDLDLKNFSLEKFENGVWVNLLSDCSLNNLSDIQIQLIESLKEESRTTCAAYKFSSHQHLNAA